MFTQLKAYIAHRHARHEVLAMTERDLDDLDLSRAELLEFIAMPHDVPDRLAAMANLLGVPEVRQRTEVQEYRDMLRACGHCRDRAHCAQFLARGESARGEAIAFCPNAMACLSLASEESPRAAA